MRTTFTLTVHDERVYRKLMERVEQGGETLDAVLLELLEQERGSETAQEDTPALKLLKLIDAAELPFEQPFDARDADDILRRDFSTVRTQNRGFLDIVP